MQFHKLFIDSSCLYILSFSCFVHIKSNLSYWEASLRKDTVLHNENKLNNNTRNIFALCVYM